MRAEIQVQLDALGEMLDHWVARVRHPAQFWPQFEMMAGEIMDQCADPERGQARACIQAMLERHALELPSWYQCDGSPPQ